MGKSYKTVIEPSNRVFPSLELRELLRFKDLFLTLAYKDYRVRYAQTLLGFLWAFIQPFATLIIFVIVFGKAVKVDTGDVPYPLFVIMGITAWSYFSYVVTQSGTALITSQEMVKKIYFPRLIIPLSKAIVGFVDYGISFCFMVVLMIYYGFAPSSNIIYMPIFILLTIVASLTIGIWLSALTIRYRDFQHVIPFIVQFGLYVTPIAYPSETVVNNIPSWAVPIYFCNPMAGVVEGFRWSVLGGNMLNSYSLLSFVLIFILFITGLFYFKKVEKTMADII